MNYIKILLILLLLGSCKTQTIKNTDSEKVESTNSKVYSSSASTVNTVAANYKVDKNDIKKTVDYLASDELKGRDTGSEGIEKAALFLETHLKDFGVQPYFETYRDDFKVGSTDAFNVVGVVEGNDPNLKNEFIVIGAHYDHIGIGKVEGTDSIANGANDNASGTATILEIARYFGKRKSNKRSILFAFFSAEEKGLQGSNHLAKRLKGNNLNLYTMLNFEMTGVPFKDRDYIAFLTGYDVSNMADVFNTYAGYKLIGKSDVSAQYNLFKRSDNYAFYQEYGLPSQTISTCDLTNFDHYHKVGDEADIMNYDHMAELTTKVLPVIESIANADNREIIMNE